MEGSQPELAGHEPGSAATPWLQRHPPPRLVRLLLRWPLLLYHLRLGWLLGHRFLVIMHRGRVTGFLRRTVVEVARYDRTTGEAIVLTPWPSQANWYQNVLKQPASEIWIAAERYRPWQRVLGPDEIAAVLDAYSEKSRLEAAGLRRLLGWGRGLPSDRRAELASLTGGVAFRRMKYE